MTGHFKPENLEGESTREQNQEEGKAGQGSQTGQAHQDERKQLDNAPVEEVEDLDEGYDDNDYIPDFVQEILDNPPTAPGENADAFHWLFESYEFDFMPAKRPKTDREYFLTLQATVASWELMRYDRMKAAILHSQQRSCAESLHRKLAAAPSSKKDASDIQATAQQGAMKYFTDPGYRREFAATLVNAGFPPNAVEAEAFLRSLPSLTTVDRLITSTEKRLSKMLEILEAAYAARDPEQPMPRSDAARRTDDLREKRAEEARKVSLNGNGKADSSQ